MKTQLSLFSALLISFSLFGQNNSATGFKPKDDDVHQKKLQQGINYDVNFDVANHEAFFPEGEDSLFRFMYSVIEIPKEAVDINLVGNAMIGFQVNFDGKVQNAYSISKVGYGIDEQLIKVLESVAFYPATQANTPYRSEVVLEIPIKAVYLSNIRNSKQ